MDHDGGASFLSSKILEESSSTNGQILSQGGSVGKIGQLRGGGFEAERTLHSRGCSLHDSSRKDGVAAYQGAQR